MARDVVCTLSPAPLPSPEKVDQVRTGVIKILSNDGTLSSAIFKTPRTGAVKVGDVGLDGDHQQSLVHGGVHKALHQYNAGHYSTWREEVAQGGELFSPGAFGENLVTYGLSEENVCIGDQFSIGNEVVVEVSEPRVPCYKLNHRFQWARARKRTQRSGRVGWYLRIVKTGSIQAGDSMQLISRPNPKWSIENTHKVLHDKAVDRALLVELSQLAPLGPDMKALAGRRLADMPDWKVYRLQHAKCVTKRVRQLTFRLHEPLDSEFGVKLPDFAHVNIKFGPLGQEFSRSYSVVSGDRKEFVLGVSLDDHSRGGSKYLHDLLQLGEEIKMSPGKDRLDGGREIESTHEGVERHVFIIGGIGVTAFINKIKILEQQGVRFEVHFACRSLHEAPYHASLPAEKTTFYPKDEQKRLSVYDCVPQPDAHGNFRCMIYCCGPARLMGAVEERTKALQYPDNRLHFESFGTDLSGSGPLGDLFEVEVTDIRTGKKAEICVPAEQTALKALRDAGFEIDSNCQRGKCGACAVSLCSGKVDHKGSGLTEEEKRSSMLVCVSRGKGKIEIEID